jgi:serine/threonine protein kinase
VDCLRGVPANCTAHLLADGTDHAPPYIVTEYVAGRSLKDIVERDGPLPPEQLRALATGVARTLAAIHQARLVHRDLKPANVLLTPTGPRVIDFGIAQRVPASGGPTGTGGTRRRPQAVQRQESGPSEEARQREEDPQASVTAEGTPVPPVPG